MQSSLLLRPVENVAWLADLDGAVRGGLVGGQPPSEMDQTRAPNEPPRSTPREPRGPSGTKLQIVEAALQTFKTKGFAEHRSDRQQPSERE